MSDPEYHSDFEGYSEDFEDGPPQEAGEDDAYSNSFCSEVRLKAVRAGLARPPWTWPAHGLRSGVDHHGLCGVAQSEDGAPAAEQPEDAQQQAGRRDSWRPPSALMRAGLAANHHSDGLAGGHCTPMTGHAR